MTYSIRDAGGSGNHFLVVETGEIFVKEKFEPSDENRQFTLTLRATDNGMTSL